MNDTKLAFKLVKCGLSFKMQMCLAIMFVGLGLFLDIASKGSIYTGGFYMAMAGLFLFQLLISIDVSTLVQSSPMKKNLQLRFPYLVVTIAVFALSAFVFIAHAIMAIKGIEGYTYEENYRMQCKYILAIGLLISLTLIYLGVCYKSFIIATLLFIICIIPVSVIVNLDVLMVVSNVWGCVAISFLMILIGLIVSYIISLLLYRKDIDMLSFRTALKRASR